MSKIVSRGILAAMTAGAMFAGASLAYAADNNSGPARVAASGLPVGQPNQALKGCFAVVISGGTPVRSKCVRSSTRTVRGKYVVIFNFDVRQCSFQATLGLVGSGSDAPPGEIAVARHFGTNDGVLVRTFNSAGAADDRSFHPTVIC